MDPKKIALFPLWKKVGVSNKPTANVSDVGVSGSRIIRGGGVSIRQ